MHSACVTELLNEASICGGCEVVLVHRSTRSGVNAETFSI